MTAGGQSISDDEAVVSQQRSIFIPVGRDEQEYIWNGIEFVALRDIATGDMIQTQPIRLTISYLHYILSSRPVKLTMTVISGSSGYLGGSELLGVPGGVGSTVSNCIMNGLGVFGFKAPSTWSCGRIAYFCYNLASAASCAVLTYLGLQKGIPELFGIKSEIAVSIVSSVVAICNFVASGLLNDGEMMEIAELFIRIKQGKVRHGDLPAKYRIFVYTLIAVLCIPCCFGWFVYPLMRTTMDLAGVSVFGKPPPLQLTIHGGIAIALNIPHLAILANFLQSSLYKIIRPISVHITGGTVAV